MRPAGRVVRGSIFNPGEIAFKPYDCLGMWWARVGAKAHRCKWLIRTKLNHCEPARNSFSMDRKVRTLFGKAETTHGKCIDLRAFEPARTMANRTYIVNHTARSAPARASFRYESTNAC